MPTVSQGEFDLDKLETPSFFPYCAYRQPENVGLFADMGPVLSLSRGYVIRARETPHYCYLVVSGEMIGTIHDTGAASRQSAFFLEGALVMEPSVLSGLASNIAFKATRQTRLMRIAHEALADAMRADERIFEAVMRSMTMKLHATLEQLRESASLDVRARIYFMLLGLAATCSEDLGGNWHRLTLKVTHQQMSDMLGVNRVTVTTALKDLHAKNAVRKEKGFYCVLDTKGMLCGR